MIEEFGYVVSLKSEEVAVVTCVKTSACKGCASEKMCSLGRDDGKRLVEVHNKLHAQPGDKVKIATTNRAFYKSSFLVYIVPLLLLLIGAVLGQWLGTHILTGIDPNLTAFALGVIFLAASFFGIRSLNDKLPKEDYMPTVVDIIAEDEAMSCSVPCENLSHGH
jgi:sigma-E factor negative regulatory protein RseC